MISAISSGAAIRPAGTRDAPSVSNASHPPGWLVSAHNREESVVTKPGRTLLTAMSWGPNSTARYRTSCSIAALAAPSRPWLPTTRSESMPDTPTIDPGRPGILGHRLGGLRLPPVVHDHVVAPPGEEQHRGPPDPPGAAGHEGDGPPGAAFTTGPRGAHLRKRPKSGARFSWKATVPSADS